MPIFKILSVSVFTYNLVHMAAATTFCRYNFRQFFQHCRLYPAEYVANIGFQLINQSWLTSTDH